MFFRPAILTNVRMTCAIVSGFQNTGGHQSAQLCMCQINRHSFQVIKLIAPKVLLCRGDQKIDDRASVRASGPLSVRPDSVTLDLPEISILAK